MVDPLFFRAKLGDFKRHAFTSCTQAQKAWQRITHLIEASGSPQSVATPHSAQAAPPARRTRRSRRLGRLGLGLGLGLGFGLKAVGWEISRASPGLRLGGGLSAPGLSSSQQSSGEGSG